MKTCLLVLALLIEVGCTSRTPSAESNPVNQGWQATAATTVSELEHVAVSEQPVPKKQVPRIFRKIDFKNLSYPISWKHEIVSLKDGRRDYYQHKTLGNGWFELDDVSYVDVTGDGKEEAVVQLHAVLCGVSCDGGSHLFYFYGVSKGQLHLMWRFETGSLGYGCGLKSFHLGKRKIALEVFNGCVFKGSALETRYEGEVRGGKFAATVFTRFNIDFKKATPILKARRVFPYAQQDLRNYSANVTINDE